MAFKHKSMVGIELRRHMAFRDKMQPLFNRLHTEDRQAAYCYFMWHAAKYVPIKELDDIYGRVCNLLGIPTLKGDK